MLLKSKSEKLALTSTDPLRGWQPPVPLMLDGPLSLLGRARSREGPSGGGRRWFLHN